MSDIRVRPLRYWRKQYITEDNRIHAGPINVGKRSYLSRDYHWIIAAEAGGWKIVLYDSLGIEPVRHELEQAGIYEAVFQTRAAAVYALETILENNVR